MANHSSRGRPGRAAKRTGSVPVFTEPEVRRWPHPVDGVAPTGRRTGEGGRQGGSGRVSGTAGWPEVSDGRMDPALYYIHCALSYQNQLLADIKALLEQLAVDQAPAQEE